MTELLDLELIADQNKISTPAFASKEDYEKFVEEFYADVRPELERLAEARIKSEEEARRRRIY